MAFLNCSNSLLVRPLILAASALPDDSSSSPPVSSRPGLKPTQLPPRELQVKLSQPQLGTHQPSIFDIERAIGAGIFRDRDDVNSKAGDKKNQRNSVGKGGEGSVEKKIRETGAWLVDQTERSSRSAGKQILMAMFIWMIPIWMLGFVVASGIIQLPFQSPYLENLLY